MFVWGGDGGNPLTRQGRRDCALRRSCVMHCTPHRDTVIVTSSSEYTATYMITSYYLRRRASSL